MSVDKGWRFGEGQTLAFVLELGGESREPFGHAAIGDPGSHASKQRSLPQQVAFLRSLEIHHSPALQIRALLALRIVPETKLLLRRSNCAHGNHCASGC